MAKTLPNQGTIHVSDTGSWLATIEEDELKDARPIPVEIDLYIDGFVYTYSLTNRREDEEAKEETGKFDSL